MKGEEGIIPARMAFNPKTIGHHMRKRGTVKKKSRVMSLESGMMQDT
jgi:hypothetical protein